MGEGVFCKGKRPSTQTDTTIKQEGVDVGG